ncbi:uncharacterized protein LOC142349160 [Convolutriloba macropyga]|uniref:uncharacterized protein LOC142349160 n=1 Tax=Convolutriloba macropyga TaxID=536237 RepID=UPI003F525294
MFPVKMTLQKKFAVVVNLIFICVGRSRGEDGWSDCSQTCGGGVSTREKCLIIGGESVCDTEIKVCNQQPCSQDDVISGHVTEWEQLCEEKRLEEFPDLTRFEPFIPEAELCRLSCFWDDVGSRGGGRNRGIEGGVYKLYEDTLLPDGTQCQPHSVCVQGTCKTVGCDEIVESGLILDKCQECGGDGSTCTKEDGVIDVQISSTGVEVSVIEIPIGATSIDVRKTLRENIFVAKSGDGRDVVNENEIRVVEENSEEQILVDGPLKTTLFISLRATKAEPVRVSYEYYVPNENEDKTDGSGQEKEENEGEEKEFLWVTTPLGECTVRCGGGIQNLMVNCVKRSSGLVYTDSYCKEQAKPSFQSVCNTHKCQVRWIATEWSECSNSCGDGVRARNVYCEQESPNMFDAISQNIIVPDEECVLAEGPKPQSRELCSGVNCPASWKVTPWSKCGTDCFQTRELQCVQNGQLVDNSMCGGENDLVPELFQKCAGCEPAIEEETREAEAKAQEKRTVKWMVNEWTQCSTECGEGVRTRDAWCQATITTTTFGHRSSPSDVTSPADVTSTSEMTSLSDCVEFVKPATLDSCYSKKGCKAVWMPSEWDKCSVVCGWGIQKRSVKCVLEGNKTTLEPSSKVSGFEVSASEISSQCNKLAKPSSQKSCFVNCDTHWTFGNWSKCSSKCMGAVGSQWREVWCEMEDRTLVNDRHCDKDIRPQSNRSCTGAAGIPACESKQETKVSTTPAECQLQLDIGSCSEKIVRYQFDKKQNKCDPFFYSGCGGNRNNFPSRAKCESTCLMGGSNVMMSDEQSCQFSPFGCCPDGVSMSRGPDFQGCHLPSPSPSPSTPLTCDQRPYGCCPDGVKVAHGPNYDGCGPLCAYTMYGCCEDNKSHAHGPNFDGCEEAMNTEYSWQDKPVPVEPSPVAPNPPPPNNNPASSDSGLSDAMVSSCAYSPYGCCPDGSAAYPDRSNCQSDPRLGCQYSTYGCCPDGETAASDTYQSNCHYNPANHREMCHGVPPDRYMNCGGTYESKYFFNETAQRCDHYWASGCQPSFGFPNFDECQSHCGGSGSSEYYHYYHHYPNHYGNYWEHYDPYLSYYGYYPYYNYGYYHNYPYYSYYPYYGYGASEQLPEQVNQAGAELEVPSVVQPVAVAPQPAPTVYSQPKPVPEPSESTNHCSGMPRTQNLCGSEYVLKYFYNSTSGMCQSYYDGGCDPQNPNSYTSRMSCRGACIPTTVADAVPISYYSYQPVAPSIAADPGYNNMYYSDYLATLDNAWTPSMEEQASGRVTPTNQEYAGVCDLQPDAGPCRAYLYRFYYNPETGKCQEFIYGGCSGNANNFPSEEECSRSCIGTGAKGVTSSRQLIADWRIIEVNRGDTAVLQCIVYPINEYSRNIVVLWKKMGAGIMEPSRSNSPIASEGNKVRVSSNGRMEINNADESDSGVYVCSINDNGDYKRDNVTLTVTDRGVEQQQPYQTLTTTYQTHNTNNNIKHHEQQNKQQEHQTKQTSSNNVPTCPYAERVRITERPATQITVPIGSTITLTCKAEGNPAPSITWSRDNERLSVGEAWTKYAWAESESGYYRCEATNGYTSDVAYFYLVVEDVRTPPIDRQQQRQLQVQPEQQPPRDSPQPTRMEPAPTYYLPQTHPQQYNPNLAPPQPQPQPQLYQYQLDATRVQCVDNRPDCNIYLSYCNNEAFFQTCCKSCTAYALSSTNGNAASGGSHTSHMIRYPIA